MTLLLVVTLILVVLFRDGFRTILQFLCLGLVCWMFFGLLSLFFNVTTIINIILVLLIGMVLFGKK